MIGSTGLRDAASMPRNRFQYHLGTLIVVVAIAAYGLALVQTSRGGPDLGVGTRIAGAVLSSRATRPRPIRVAVDPLFIVAASATALFAVHRRRESARPTGRRATRV